MNVIKNSWKLQYWKQSRSKQISVVRVPRYKTAKNISLRFPSSIHCSVNIWGHWKSTFAIGIIVHRTRLKINFEFQNPCNITSVIIQLSDSSNPFLSRGVGNGGRRAPSEFSVSVNPIQTMGAYYAQHTTTCPLGFKKLSTVYTSALPRVSKAGLYISIENLYYSREIRLLFPIFR